MSQRHAFHHPGCAGRVEDRGGVGLFDASSGKLGRRTRTRHHGLELGGVEQYGAVSKRIGDFVSGGGGCEGDDRFAEVDLAGNLGIGAGGVGRRDGDAE